jgi:photosystem II stability/assembly factor-like uncharacterized protein
MVLSLVSAVLLAVFPAARLRSGETEFHAELLTAFSPRPIGPAVMSGRMTGVAVVESKPSIMYAASASGGLWKTVNEGASWTQVFDNESCGSIGDVAVSASNPDIVWVGTGEANARNSVSWGDGVFKSEDGGKAWQHMGLKDSRHIGRIVIHPKDPDTVYVAALGHLWGANKERGIFKTTDGGKTWQAVCQLNDETGFVDLAMNPSNPDVLYGCAYRVKRDAFSGGNPAVQTGPDAGIYKTEDAGKTWKKLTEGLPARPMGRCGIAIARSNPQIVYAVVQTDETKLIRASELGQEAKPNDKPENGGIFRSSDSGKTWAKLNDLCPRPFYYSQIRVDPNDDKHIYVLGVSMHISTDGGKTFRSTTPNNVHPDMHALWIDPSDSNRMVVANDGGLCLTHDQGKNWEHFKNLPVAQLYTVAVDMHTPYRIFGGLQDNGTWGGASATHYKEGITNADWFRVAAADGFYVTIDRSDSETVYCESQYAGFVKRVNLKSSAEKEIQPVPAKGHPTYRYNWCTPILLSSHDSHVVYLGANHLIRSRNRGDNWEEVSPDLTLGKPGPSDDMGHTITTIAESPVKSKTLLVGTDDGRVWVTKTGGDNNWTDVSEKIPCIPAERCIDRLECSHFDEGTCYVALSRHRNDDMKPYIFKTTDFGATWKPIANDLPAEGPVHVVREDPENRDLLFVGTEFGLFVSLNGGDNWLPIRNGFPPVPVFDLVIHPRDRELVIGTHGRGVYVLNIKPLEELTSSVVAEPLHLFDIKGATAFAYRPARTSSGKTYTAPNPDYGAEIYYYLKEPASEAAKIDIVDPQGKTLVTLEGDAKAGVHRLVWDLRAAKTEEGKPIPSLVKAGDYTVRLEVGEKVMKKKVHVEAEK